MSHDVEIAEKVRHLSPEELALYRIRHSLAHVLAAAVSELYPGTALGFGPPVADGFYYDFLLPGALSADDLPAVEARMREILARGEPFVAERLAWEEARARVRAMAQPFKLELLDDLRERGVAEVGFYRTGSFVDVCEGPHVAATSEIPSTAFRLDSVAGAYWKGSEENAMLTRVYGLAFASEEELTAFVARRAEAQRRDHRRLGAELDVFEISDEVGKGLPLWLPNGTAIRDELEKLAKEAEFLDGYQRVATPEVAREELFLRSGHLPYYADDMFPPMEVTDPGRPRERFYLKPMNCPFHHLVYKARPRSFRDLPLRLAEYGHVYRWERSGVLSGLTRVRGMCMNDAHLYVPPEDAKDEFKRVLALHFRLYEVLGLHDYSLRLSLSAPGSDKYIPRPDLWHAAETVCREVLDEMGLPYRAAPGEAAFYGPKVDVQLRNVLGREETASTCQVDPMAALEERFDLTYVAKGGERRRPWVLHRAPLGTHERFVAFLLEHFGGAFPLWLAPVQVLVLPAGAPADGGDQVLSSTHALRDALRARFVRAEVDDGPGSLARKVREASVRKVPLIAVVGRREAAAGTVTVRRREDPERQETLARDAFVAQVTEEIRERRLPVTPSGA